MKSTKITLTNDEMESISGGTISGDDLLAGAAGVGVAAVLGIGFAVVGPALGATAIVYIGASATFSIIGSMAGYSMSQLM